MVQVVVICDVINFDEVLFVLDVMIGQDVVIIVVVFGEGVGFIGVVLIKFDGDVCGGVVLLVCEVIGVLIFFVFIGEKLEDFDVFYLDWMVSCILGMGDVLSLIEQVEQVFDV